MIIAHPDDPFQLCRKLFAHTVRDLLGGVGRRKAKALLQAGGQSVATLLRLLFQPCEFVFGPPFRFSGCGARRGCAVERRRIRGAPGSKGYVVILQPSRGRRLARAIADMRGGVAVFFGLSNVICLRSTAHILFARQVKMKVSL
jgi:hypothetical protein